jgi:hypothetical protein
MTDKGFEDILDDCLERLFIRGESIEDCLAAYPQQADNLKPLLQTALTIKNTAAIEPRPEFKARARYQFHTALQEMAPKKNRFFSIWRFRWATALITILVILTASGGLVAAAGTSMPDDFLYPVKLAVEQLQLKLTPSDLGKANLYAKFADRRVTEIIHMAQEGNASLAEATTQRLYNQLAMIVTLVSVEDQDQRQEQGNMSFNETVQPPNVTYPVSSAELDDTKSTTDTHYQDKGRAELEGFLQQNANENSSELRDLLVTAPEAVKPVLLQAIAILEAGYENALNAISE